MDSVVIKIIPQLTEHQLKLFWAKVQKSNCWEWTAATVKGYGSFGFNGKTYLAHRISYAIAYEDPLEMCVCHSCDNPLCVNPAHLWLGTPRDNDLDRDQKGRQARGTNINTNVLTEHHASEILASINIPQKVLATKYGVSEYAISAIRSGKTWKHLKGKRRTSEDAYSNNKLGVKGVCRIKNGKFQASVNVNGKSKYLGLFETVKEAQHFRKEWLLNHDHYQTTSRRGPG